MDYQLEQLKATLLSYVAQNGVGVAVGPLLQQVTELVKVAKEAKVSSAEAKKKVLEAIETALKAFPQEAVGVADKIRMVLLPAVNASFGYLDGRFAACFSWVWELFSRKKAILSSFESVVPLGGVVSAIQAGVEEPKVPVVAGEAAVVAPAENLVLREADPVLAGTALVEEPVKAVEKMD
jgi:hypothetical protein